MAQDVLILAPDIHVHSPWPAQMVGEGTFQGQRTLFEIVKKMRRQFRDVAGTVLRGQIFDHHGRAAPDAAKAFRFIGHIQCILVDFKPVLWGRPSFERRQIGMGLRLGVTSR